MLIVPIFALQLIHVRVYGEVNSPFEDRTYPEIRGI